MKTFNAIRKAAYILAFVATLVTVLASTTKHSRARTQMSSITIVNNSGREIRHVYLSPPNSDNWGPDQLNHSVINSGGSYTLGNVSCPQASIKVIAEDQNGCFFYQIVNCADNATWTITSDATPDCGG